MTRKEAIKKWLGDNPVVAISKKLAEYGAIAAVFWLYLLPKLEDKIQAEIAADNEKQKQEESSKIPFRTLMANEVGVQSDRVHIYMGEIARATMAATDSINKFSEYWVPYLEQMLDEKENNIEPRLIIIDDEEWWLADNNKMYRVTRNEADEGFYFFEGEWKPIFN